MLCIRYELSAGDVVHESPPLDGVDREAMDIDVPDASEAQACCHRGPGSQGWEVTTGTNAHLGAIFVRVTAVPTRDCSPLRGSAGIPA